MTEELKQRFVRQVEQFRYVVVVERVGFGGGGREGFWRGLEGQKANFFSVAEVVFC